MIEHEIVSIDILFSKNICNFPAKTIWDNFEEEDGFPEGKETKTGVEVALHKRTLFLSKF